MAPNFDWIWTALARDQTKTQKGLADAIGVDKSAITKLKRNHRQLKLEEAQKAAAYLGVPLPTGFSEDAEKFSHAPLTAPLFNVKDHSDGFWRLDRNAEPVDRRPPGFGASTSVFGFYAPSDIMSPRFKIGEVVWTNPARPAAPRDDALLIETKPIKGAERILLCELVDIQETEFAFIQHSDGDLKTLPRKRWSAIHVLPRR